MKIKLQDYIKELEKKVRKNEVSEKLANEAKDYVDYYQHERLIKLITSLFMGAVVLSFLVCGLCFENLLMYAIFGIVFIFFLPYIIAFYLLEKRFQKLSNLYFKIKRKLAE
jgi:Flp pilus assembly protein TadB